MNALTRSVTGLVMVYASSFAASAFADGAVTKKMDLPYAEGQGVSRATEADNWGSCLPTERTLASNSVVEIELELAMVEKSSTIFCNRVGESDRTYTLLYVVNKGWRFDYNNSSAATYGGMPEAGKRYNLKLSPEGLWVDGVQTLTKIPADFVIPTKLSLYCNYTYKESTQEYTYNNWGRGKVKIYSFKVYEPDALGSPKLVYELKPCLASTGKVGFSDTGTDDIYLASSVTAPLASTFTSKFSDGAQGIVTALGLASEAAKNGTSTAYYGYKFNVAIEAGVYDLKGLEMASGSHLSVGIAKGGRIIGLGATPGDTVLLGGGETAAKRVVALGTMTLTNLTVTGGYVSSSDDGGGVKASSAGVGAVLGCIITNNYAKGSNGNGGGGLWGVGTVRGCLIASNRSTNGGGLRACSTVVDCVISNNTSTSAGGGASSGSFENCVIVTNVAGASGGGVTTSGSLKNCAIIGNTAANGGGLEGSPSVETCVISNNYGDSTAGGAWGGTFTNCLFVANSAGHNGGGLRGGCAIDCRFYENNGHAAGSYGSGGGVSGSVASNCTFVCADSPKASAYYGAIAAAGAKLVGCVVTNCAARRSLFDNTRLERCYVADCRKNTPDGTYSFAVCGSNAGDTNTVVNCVFENIAFSDGVDRVAYCRRLFNCTIRNVTGASSGTLGESCVAVNTIVAGCEPFDIKAANGLLMTNCIYQTSTGTFAEGQLVSCRQVADIKWAKTGPTFDIRASSAAFNRGYEDADILALVGETDFAGRPRKMFGALDIGALECQDPTRPGFMLLFR